MILALMLSFALAEDPPPPEAPVAAASADPAPAEPVVAEPVAEAPADAEDDGALIPGLPPGPPPPADRIDEITREISEGLRCPVCQGLSIADSSANAAVMMVRRTRGLVAAGYTRLEIEDYFISKYGEWVLLDPRQGGLNQLVWIGPALAFGLGLLAAVAFLRRAGDAVPVRADADAPPPDDDFSRRILNEADDD